MVRKRIGWLASLATAMSLFLFSGSVARGQPPTDPTYAVLPLEYVARGQDPTNTTYEVPPPEYVVASPLGHPRMEDGGFYVAGGFKFMMSTNPIHDQPIAFHGILDRDGSIGTALGIPGAHPNEIIGDGSIALSAGQVRGPLTFVPGYEITAGYRFQSGIAVEFNMFHLFQAKYSATASQFLPFGQNTGAFQENTFLTSPVFNYSQAFSGEPIKVPLGNPASTSGIWDASSIQTIDFTQRYDQWQFNIRYPLQQTDCYRFYGLFGPRAVWIWERFHWLTVAPNANGFAGATDQADYTNVVSNRLYGVHLGCGNEWLISTSPIGAFAISCDLEGAIFANFVDAQATYVLGDNSTGASRRRNFFTVVPEVQANINLWWYPYEGIQVRAGYDAMAFFNTASSPDPVDFNVGALTPGWATTTFRFMHGLNASIAFIF